MNSASGFITPTCEHIVQPTNVINTVLLSGLHSLLQQIANRIHGLINLNELGHEIEFKYVEKMDPSMSKKERLLIFELLR
jgi:hypothetical protein